MKKCKTCKKEFESTTEFFYSRTSTLDGLSSNCKRCYSDIERQRYRNGKKTKVPPKRDLSREQKQIWCRVSTDLSQKACLLTGYKLSPTIDYILKEELILCDLYFESGESHRVHLTVDKDRFDEVKTIRSGKFGKEKNEKIVNVLLYSFINQ